MILGTGIDIIEVARIRASIEKFGDRFLKRILRPDELAYCFKYRHPAPHVAARFAAKEAISKAFGTGIGRELGWHDMEIGRKESSEPFVILHDAGQKLLAARGARLVHLSLSHTENYAVALAILEEVARVDRESSLRSWR
jgi:holo-[acyl-carrier protein] synthase